MWHYGHGSSLPTTRSAANVQFQPPDSNIYGVPNMHLPVGDVTVPPPFSGMYGQLLIDMSVPSVNRSHMVSSVLVGNRQGIPNQSMGAPYSQTQMSQGGTAYTWGNSITQYQNPHGNPLYNTVPQRNCYTSQPMYTMWNQTMGGAQSSSGHPSSPWSKSGAPNNLPFLATLDIPDLYKLTNNPIFHSLQWPLIPHKIPIDIPKFNGKQGEDPGTPITTYHLWSVSNSIVDDSVQLQIFPRTLTGNVAKWYIELPRASVNTFDNLAMEFLNHFQLPIRYEAGTKLLTSFH